MPKEDTLKDHVHRACTKAVDAVMWIEMIVSFIQGAMACSSISSLWRIPVTTPVVHLFMSGVRSNVPEEWSSEEEDSADPLRCSVLRLNPELSRQISFILGYAIDSTDYVSTSLVRWYRNSFRGS
jgi:hypothetical protein